jgi:hypothetical protein
VGIFKTFKDMKATAAEHGGVPNLRDSYTDMSKMFDDRGEREILSTGITAMGIVRGFVTPVPGDRFAMSIPIEVHPPEGVPYSVDYIFPTVRMQAAIAAGMEIPIKISRDDPSKIAVQWDAQKAQIAAAGGATSAVLDGLSKTYGPATQAAMGQAMNNLRAGTGGNPPPTTFQPDAQSRIEKLEQLKNAGLIDDATYQAKKQKIVDEI